MQQEQIRVRLTSAARRLVDIGGARVSADAVAQAAALPPRAIHQTYGGFDELLYELLGQLYGEARDRALRLTANMPAGRSRLKLAVDGYLHALFERPGLQALALQLRSHPRAIADYRRHQHGLTLMLEIELQGLNWSQPAATAQLCASAIEGIAAAEAAAGRRLPELRDSLYRYFDAPP
ncbi:hypothetical protein [Solimonas marina]|uniref:TetR family transcriptional regulator n=1 Tax=Solimonas marina TaxID=2714601 RepID=A0A969WBZ1_9GAMM|nr:hypothetical protein [Solimonas marina]NKF24566.1 hypothetical protein [Solimonas marina]